MNTSTSGNSLCIGAQDIGSYLNANWDKEKVVGKIRAAVNVAIKKKWGDAPVCWAMKVSLAVSENSEEDVIKHLAQFSDVISPGMHGLFKRGAKQAMSSLGGSMVLTHSTQLINLFSEDGCMSGINLYSGGILRDRIKLGLSIDISDVTIDIIEDVMAVLNGIYGDYYGGLP